MSNSSKAQNGFTLVEIIIVISIVAVLAALSVPYYLQYVRDSQRSTCIANLKTLYGAVEQRRMKGLDEIGIEELCSALGYVKGKPRCPADKSQPYDISGEMPLCRTPGPACRTCRGARGGGGVGTLPRGA